MTPEQQAAIARIRERLGDRISTQLGGVDLEADDHRAVCDLCEQQAITITRLMDEIGKCGQRASRAEALVRLARHAIGEVGAWEGITDWAALYDHEMEVLADLVEEQAQEMARLTALARELAEQVEVLDQIAGHSGRYADCSVCELLTRPDVRALREP